MSLIERHPHHSAVESLVHNADVELIPLKTAGEKLPLIPAGTTITITCSSKLGLDRTLEVAAVAAKAGYDVVPHLAARQVPDLTALQTFIGKLDELGVHNLYVIGGDAPKPAGIYTAAGDVLEALSGFSHGITSIGVACYPEGHPAISDASLKTELHRKQPLANYMVSQLCFDHAAIDRWLHGVRADGITLPLHLGLAAPMQVRKLAGLSLKIGVGSSVRYLTKQHGFIGNVLRGSSYRPEKLLEQLGDLVVSPEMNIERVHLFSFNQIEATVAWQAGIASAAAA